MFNVSDLPLRLLSALAIGLLIGAERERRKGEGSLRSAAGIRTFAVVSLIGAVTVVVGNECLLAVAMLAITALCTAAYLRSPQDDPGLTTEVTLILTVLLGGLSVRYPGIAAGMAVAVAALLALRERIHNLVSRALTASELKDALLFAVVIFVILPLVPNRFVGPFHAINLHTIWVIVILMMTVSAAGYVAIRLIGPRFGLPVAGFAAGFVSSTATIAAMGSRTLQEPALKRMAVAGAVLSTVATIAELAIVLAAINRATLSALAIPLVASGTMALLYGLVFTMKTLRCEISPTPQKGRAFSLSTALAFAATIAFMLLLSAVLNAWMGQRGVILAAAGGGFADTHAPAVSVASLVSAGTLTATDSAFPILAALTTNTFAKMVVAVSSGGRPFAIQVIPGLLLVIASAWAAAFLQ